MKKGQRPSRHYRVIRTKKGKKRVLVNKSVHKRKVKHSKPAKFKKWQHEQIQFTGDSGETLKAKDLSEDELLRRYKQQVELNLKRDYGEELSELEGFAKEIKHLEDQLVSNEEKLLVLAEQSKVKKDDDLDFYDEAYGAVSELSSIGRSLERKRKNKLEFYKDEGVEHKINVAKDLARKSGNKELLDTANALEDFFEKEVLDERYKKGGLSPTDSALYRAGKKALKGEFYDYGDTSFVGPQPTKKYREDMRKELTDDEYNALMGTGKVRAKESVEKSQARERMLKGISDVDREVKGEYGEKAEKVLESLKMPGETKDLSFTEKKAAMLARIRKLRKQV